MENLAYYCKLNQCGVSHNKFLYEILSKAVEGEDAFSIRSLHHIIFEVATKTDALQSQNASLHSQIQATSELFTKISNTTPSTPTKPLAISVNSIADKLLDRKCREANVVVYNLPGLSDKLSDRSQFVDLYDKVFSIKAGIVKSLRLGKCQENKPRPFLITLESLRNKEIITSCSYLLHNHEQYKSVFVSPDT